MTLITIDVVDDTDDGRLIMLSILLHLGHSFVWRVRPPHLLRRSSLMSVHPIRCSTRIITVISVINVISVITAINATTPWSLLLLDAIPLFDQTRLLR